MNELQECQFRILKAFIEVCEKHNLTYFLVGGTALGAVRHKGFIPWDDDIDVGMPREDYEKYILLQKEYEGTPYFIQTYKSDPNFIYNYAKLRDSSTTFIENYYKDFQMNHGVWIDIFPIDGTPENTKDDPKKFGKKVLWTWKQVYWQYLGCLRRKFSKRTFFKDLGLNIVYGLFFWVNVGHYTNKRIDKRIKKYSYKDSEYLANWLGTNPKKEAMPRDVYDGEPSKATFEGMEVNLPHDYDRYLTLLYGDYMTPPPANKQEGHHHHAGLDLHKNYIEYRKEHRL